MCIRAVFSFENQDKVAVRDNVNEVGSGARLHSRFFADGIVIGWKRRCVRSVPILFMAFQPLGCDEWTLTLGTSVDLQVPAIDEGI